MDEKILLNRESMDFKVRLDLQKFHLSMCKGMYPAILQFVYKSHTN